MEEERKQVSQENNTSRELENPASEIQNSPSSSSRSEPVAANPDGDPVPSVTELESFSSLTARSTHSTSTSQFQHQDKNPTCNPSDYSASQLQSHKEDTQLPCVETPSAQSGHKFSRQDSGHSSSSSPYNVSLGSSLPLTNSSPVSKELAKSTALHPQTSQDCAQRTSKTYRHGLESSLSEDSNQGTPYLLPETSGFISSSRGAPVELKRGRGRPRKEGLNPLLRKPSSRGLGRGLGRPLGRPFGSRGLSRGLGRGLGRGSRGGRRGRPPIPHAGLSVISSPSSSLEGDSPSQVLSPPVLTPLLSAPLVIKPDILPPSGMAEFLKQNAATASSPAAGNGGNSAPTSTSASPVQGTPAGNPSAQVSEIATTPDIQNPGHLCSLCNCGERSLLGQGETWRFEPSPDFDVFKLPEPKTLREADEVDTVGKNKGPQPTTWRRSRGPLKTGRERSRSPRQSGEEESSGCDVNDELALVGFPDDTEIAQLFEPTGHVWVHHCCALWSKGVTVGETHQLEDVDKAVYNALSNRCSHCRKFGATLICCIPDCGKRFHFPCASAGGCFQDMKTLQLLCPDHIDQAEAIAGNAASCIQCGKIGSVKEQLFCTSCGHHYHGNCLCPPVDMKPIARAGWQCPNCKICQTCRTASDDSRMLVCDKCDKGYHTFCLKPAMTTIPKNGWKCKSCRVCTDCGSRTPGSGPSSRWHLNYSVCDSCYQQRNKGLCCPLCGKAYRHFHNKTMLPCMICKKFVHIDCDPSINPNVITKSKELPQDYVCTVCRETDPDALMDMEQPYPTLHRAVSEESMESFMTDDLVSKDDPMLTEAALSGPSGTSGPNSSGGGGLTASSSQESLFMCDDSSSSYDFETPERQSMMSPSSRRDSFELFTKKGRQKSKHSSSEKYHHHHHYQHHHHLQQQSSQPQQHHQHSQQPSLCEKRRGPKIKVKIGNQVMGIASLDGSSPISRHSLSQPPFSISSPSYSTQSVDGQIEEKEKEKEKEKASVDEDDDDGDDHPSTLIIAESTDMFIMDQDICKACGSFGKEEESKMIVCTQCGQCYHPYCVSVTVTKVMLQKGWRCLDCTVCEGCGGPDDEGRLLLCDDCDISYHTYCLVPPLETVPKGNWKCKWCVMCVNCGNTSPGFACQWMNNYTQCGPCHSKIYCPVCSDSYLIDQLIIQCQQCDRWLHCECDGLACEDEAEIAADYGYHCLFCRPKTGKEGPLPPPPPPPSPPKEERVPTPPPAISYMAPVQEPPRQFFVDGVYLFASGLTQIQRLQVTNPKKIKQQQQQRRMSQLEEPEEMPQASASTAGEAMESTNADEVGEDGVKKRKPRRVFGLGVGGFIVRQRSRQWLAKRQASYEEQEEQDKGTEQGGEKTDKPKRRRKIKKSKLEEAFPFYMQEAFFGKGILDQTKETTKGLLKTESDSDQERSSPTRMMPASDLAALKAMGADVDGGSLPGTTRPHTSMSGSEQGEDIHSLDESELKDILHEFQDNDDIFSIIREELKDDGLSLDSMEAATGKDAGPSKTSELPDNIANMLTSDMDKDVDVDRMISEGLVHFDSKVVEDIFSGVLSEPQPGQSADSNTPAGGQFGMPLPQGMQGPSPGPSTGPSPHPPPHPPPHPGISPTQGPGMRGPVPGNAVSGPPALPPFGMPYNPSFGPQMGQNFGPGMGPGPQGQPGPSGSLPPWGMVEEDPGDSNKRTILKWEQEEEMGDQATISCVLYVNMCHPDLKQKHPDWSERSKQIAKLWRKLTPEEKTPYLSKARKNRTSSRVQKAQKKKAAQKSKNQVSQELQRRQEIQKQQDCEAMPPPPAPPPLPPGEHFHDGTGPMMSPHPGASPYPRHPWQEDGKQPGTPTSADHPGPQGDQVFSPQGPGPAGGVGSPDPYAFGSPGQSDPFSPNQPRPVLRPPHRLPGLQTFGASSPRDDEGLFNPSGMSPRVRPNSDMFPQGPPTPGRDMFMGGPRRPQGPVPRMSLPGQADASNPLGDSNQPRTPSDPYTFAPNTPQTPSQPDDPFLPPGPPGGEAYPGRAREMYPGGSPQMRPPLTPTSMGPGASYPGSPVRMPDPNFRHPLSRSNSLPDPYSMQMGTPRPHMDPSMSRSMSDVSPEGVPMYPGGRMPLQHPEDGGENPGNSHHQQLRVILGQQTKQRMAKKQEEAERMMQGPSPGWQGQDGGEGLEGFPARPPFRGPSPQGFMRGPHPGMGPPGVRPPFFPGNMQRPPHSEAFPGQAPEGMMTDQHNFIEMMHQRMGQSGSQPTTPSGPVPTSQQMGSNLPPFMPPGGDPDMMRQPPPQQQPQHQAGATASPSEPHPGLTRQISSSSQAGEDEMFSGGNETAQASTSKAPGSADSGAVESDTLLEGIDEKAAKPSLSSEEDKNEDDDLLSADGTFDILKYADPDLDLDLDDKMLEHLGFIEDQANGQSGDQKKSDEEKSEDIKEETKEEKDAEVTSRNAAAADFQAQFLEFNQRQKSEAKKEKDEAAGKSSDDKDKDKSEVGPIVALLHGNEAMSSRMASSEPTTPDVKPPVGEGVSGMGVPRAPYNPNLASPHMQMSPSQVPQPGSSGLPSPKIMHSPRSGQPSPRTPGIQSPFNAVLGGRHSASPHSQPMTPGGPQLSPFSGNGSMPFSPPVSSGAQQPYVQGPGSAPHSPYPTSSQPPFVSVSTSVPPHMMSPGYPQGGMGLRAPGGFNQMGHPGGPRGGPIYGIRPPDGQSGRFPRPGDGGMEGVEGLGPRMPQPMTLPDGRPIQMYQQMQARGMRGPPPTSTHPSLQQQLTHAQSRHQFPGQPPRLSHPPQVRAMGPRQPGPPFSGAQNTVVPQGQPGGREQHTLLDELLEQEKEEQKRQAEQQAMMHRREGGGPPGEQGMPVMSSGPPPTSGGPLPPHTVGGMPMRMEHPVMRMQGPPDGSGPVWPQGAEGVPGGPPPGPFPPPPGFPTRMLHPGMQRPPVPFPGPPELRGPGPSGGGPPQSQPMPMGPPTPVNPPSGDIGPEYERQAVLYEDWLAKQALYLESQVKSFETQVNKLKRSKKTIQARQRQAKKNGQELNPVDTAELERISTEQSGLQKQLEAQRKALRQHQHTLQDYKQKQQEQFGRMWTGGMAETPMPGSSLPIAHPRTPGGHNSVRLSPTARQEYDAYMQHRIRLANQQSQQQQNRMRPPTTILGDNNPFSEAFQQREQMQRAPLPPGAAGPQTSGGPPQMQMPGAGPPPLRPPFNMGAAPEQSTVSTTVTSSSAISTAPISSSTTSTPSTPSTAPTPATTVGPPHTSGGPPPFTTQPVTSVMQGQPLPSGAQGTPMTTGPQIPPMTTGQQTQPMAQGPQGQHMAGPQGGGQGQSGNVPPGIPGPGPRGPIEGMRMLFTERNAPFEGGAGPRFHRPPGPGNFPEGPAPGQGPNPRLPPYPGGPGMFPQGAGPAGPAMEQQNRMQFQPGMTFPPGMTIPPGSQIPEVPPTTQAGVKEKKKRKKKKKTDELEGAQSQPLPPSLPSQSMLGQMSSQPPSTMTSPSTVGPAAKLAEMPKPQSETERRILEILNNSQKELQNPASPSSARGGKSPRSRSPARAQPAVASESDKIHPGGVVGGALPVIGPGGVPATSESQGNGGSGTPEGPVTALSSATLPGEKQPMQGDGKNTQAGGYPTTVSSVSTVGEGQTSTGSTPTSAPQPSTQGQQRMPVHGGQIPPGFPYQQHPQNLQNLARMQQFHQQFPGIPEGQRHGLDPQQMPMGGPRYPQLHPFSQRQRFPPAVGQPPHPFHGRPPHIRGGHPQYPPHMQGMAQRMSQDPRMQGAEPHLMPPHSMMAQRMPAGAAGMPPHLSQRPPVSLQGPPTSQPPPSSLPQQISQAPPLSHMPPVSSVHQYQGHSPSHTPHTPPASAAAVSLPVKNTTASTLPSVSTGVNSSTATAISSSAVPASSSQPSLQTQGQSLTPSSLQSMSQSTPSSSTSSFSTSNIPAEVTNQSQTSGAQTTMAATNSSTTTAAPNISSGGTVSAVSASGVAGDSKKGDGTKKACDDGVHCGTDDEDDGKSKNGAKKVCDDGIHCGTDDEEDNVPGQSKKVCSDGIHCGTDDEEENTAPNRTKKVCDDGIHCGTDDEEDNVPGQSKKVCSDGIHCGTDDEEENAAPNRTKKVCDDGIHCGTDDEEDNVPGQSKKVCSDGIHCGTDDEEENAAPNRTKKVCDDGIHCGTDDEEDNVPGQSKKVCSDGIHCGTDDEEENAAPNRTKKVCDDGIHCGTDDEEDNVPGQSKKVCSDGIHCGTDDEEENAAPNRTKKVCDDGIHCGTDDEEDNVPGQSKKVCSDGIHCGTDDEEENAAPNRTKKVCDDGIHCGTDDEEENIPRPSKKVCDDGIHCGTDDEEEKGNGASSKKVCSDGIHCGTDDEEDNVVMKKKKCDDGIHCGTDDEDESAVPMKSKKKCEDGIHCGTDDEEENVHRKAQTSCTDGIHCGTDDEEGNLPRTKSKPVCSDGIHCGTDDEDENTPGSNETKKVCDDGIHCGTDDEEENPVPKKSRKTCDDGIHCGTDDEDENATVTKSKKVCDDGIHCGTDDEEENAASNNIKKVCDDGIHCGTDDEEENITVTKSKKVCNDGIHCGTDDEDENATVTKSKKVCDDGIHCGTDDEEENTTVTKSKKVCNDGIHCGTDDEDENTTVTKSKKVCNDGIHCGTDDEEENTTTAKSKQVCDDGIHCGTDDEGEQNPPTSKLASSSEPSTATTSAQVNNSNTSLGERRETLKETAQTSNSVVVKSSTNQSAPTVKDRQETGMEVDTNDTSQTSLPSASTQSTTVDSVNSTSSSQTSGPQGVSNNTDIGKVSNVPSITGPSSNSLVTTGEATTSSNVPFVSNIHSQISSQLAAVSRSLANFKPRIDPDASEPTVSAIRPSDTLSVFSFPSSSPSSSSSTATTVTAIPAPSTESSTKPSVPKGDPVSSGSPVLPEVRSLSIKPQEKEELNTQPEPMSITSTPQSLAPAGIPTTSTAKESPQEPEPTAPVDVNAQISTTGKNDTAKSPISSQPLLPSSTPTEDTGSSQARTLPAFSFSYTEPISTQDSAQNTSQVQSLPSAPTTSSISSSVSSSVPAPIPITAPSSQVQSIPESSLPPVPPPPHMTTPSTLSQVPKVSPVPTATSNSPTFTENLSSSNNSSTGGNYSRSGASESRPSIPPLRIRMDGQSQRQVYGSSIPPSREHYKSSNSEFSSVPSRKAEGDLKLVLRKSSDGTAELISGPSFREKKRSTSTAEVDSPASSSRPDVDQKTAASPSFPVRMNTPPSSITTPVQPPTVTTGPPLGDMITTTAFTSVPENPQPTISTSNMSQPSHNVKTLDLNPAAMSFPGSTTPTSNFLPTSSQSSVQMPQHGFQQHNLMHHGASHPNLPQHGLPFLPASSSPSAMTAMMQASQRVSTPTTPTQERTVPYTTKPGSGLFKNVTYTKSPDTDVVKINVGSSKTNAEGTKKIIRSYTTDIQALERLQSTIDAVASGESSFEPDVDSEPSSRPESRDSVNSSTPRPPSASSAASNTTMSSDPGNVGGGPYYPGPGGQTGMGQSPQHQQQQYQQQQHQQQQMVRGMAPPHQRPQMQQQQSHPQQQQQQGYLGQSQQGFSPHQPFHPSRMSRPPLDLLAQVSQSALSSAGTAIPTSTHPPSQEQRSPYMTERSPSGSAEHSPLHSSPHPPYPGMMGPRPVGTSQGMTPKSAPGQTSQAYMQGATPGQQQFMAGGRFPPRMHHDMSGATPYGMSPHPMSPTGMHRQRPPHFGMGGEMGRMPRPPRGMPHPQHRPMPPEMMSPEHGMRPRMPPQFMSPTHAGLSDMPPTSHGMPMTSHAMTASPHGMPQSPHGMQTSPHGMQTSPHGMQTSPLGMQQNAPHGMQRPPMMNPHHTMMPGGPPSSYPQTSMSGGGGPLASLANFHPPGHPSINTSLGSPMPGPHHQRPQMFQQQMMGEARMAARLRMMASGGDGHMPPHFRHMMMRGMTPPGSQPPSQMTSPQMSPHMSPQMSPGTQTQPLRHLDSMPDEKGFVTSLPSSSPLGQHGMVDVSMGMGGKPKQQRSPFGPGMLPNDPSGFMASHHPPHMQLPGDVGPAPPPGMSPPMSDTAVAITSKVKLEPSEDSTSADGSITRDDLDLDRQAIPNELLKQLLGTGQGGRQLPTPDSEDSLPSLTPEQQRQLEMIDSMPLCKEKDVSPEYEGKTPEEREQLAEMRRQEYEQKRQEYEVSRKNKRKTIGAPGAAPLEKKKRKPKGSGELGVDIPKKRSKKAKLKETQLKELEAQAETFLQQLHNMPPIQLQEPIIATSMSILPVKGAPNLTGLSTLRGRYCSAYIDGIEDMYGSLLFPQPPPGLRPTVPSAEILAQRQLANEAKLRMMQGIDPLQMLKVKDGNVQGVRPGPRTSPRLILPPQPRIEIKSEQIRKEERETPDTIVSSSSPEFGFNEQEPEYPGLRPIDPATSNVATADDTTSPVVPLVHPLPVKPATSSVLDQQIGEAGIKQELSLAKHNSGDLELGLAGPSGAAEQPARDLTVNLPNLTSGLAQPFLDPALDQQVSVTLTLSTGAAQDIGAVISAIADLLKIAVPPTYEITRSPSPEMFRMSLTHKEEAVNIHTLMSTRPRFCQQCDVFVLCSGITKYKREFPMLLEQEPDCGDEEMIFCSMNCSMQFSAGLEARQRQAQLRLKELESSPSTSQTPPPFPPVKLEMTSSATPSRETVASNVDEIIAAVASDRALSPRGPDTPGDMSASPGTPSTTPTSPLPTTSPGGLKAGKRHRRSSSQVSDSAYLKPLVKKWRGLRWKRGNQDLLDGITKLPSTPLQELDRLWKSLGMIHTPKPEVEDKRKCVFCQVAGDGENDGPSRLLNMDVNKWVHLNCALWSYDVYETLNGALMNVDLAFQRSSSIECTACRKTGATLACFKPRCTNSYHLPCARQRGCMFYQDKTLLCPNHIPKVPLDNELKSLVVLRRVYINRDEDRQVASMLHQEERLCSLRIGSLILHNIGQLLPHQILSGKFNTKEYIYPVGFRTSRFYWSFFSLYNRCRYECSIHDNEGEPEFWIQIKDVGHKELTFKDRNPAAAWMHILKPLERMRREADLVKMFPTFKGAEELFGLTEPNVVKVLESLPGTDLLQNYNFKYGRSPLIEMPPAINPTGCARTEPKLRTHFRRPHTLQSTNSRSLPSTVTGVTGDTSSPYLKQFVHSKSQQYRRLKSDWKTLVYLGRSRIQGLGLYAARDLEKHTMVIEYIGDLIRNEVANRREKEYESQNRGVYMFRIDNEVVIDATMAGGPARYINHSCNPNCVAEVVDIEKESKIIIITSRKIVKGEELTYDYKFDFEDDQHKIPCMCGATNCRKWMN